MRKICLDWKNLFSPSNGQFVVEGDNNERIERQKERYAEIFKPELGTIKGVSAKLHLKDNVKPVFQKACPAVEKELKKMEDEGIIEPVEVSKWAIPIVCVQYLKRMAQYTYVVTIRGLSTLPFKRSSFLFRR